MTNKLDKPNPIVEFFQFVIDYSKANIRNKRLMAAERIALRLTKEDRRTRWIIRWKQYRYYVFTKYEVDDLKKKGVLAQDTTIAKLYSIADSWVRHDSATNQAYIAGKNKTI